MKMTLENLKSICGKGLIIKKLWVEIQKLQSCRSCELDVTMKIPLQSN